MSASVFPGDPDRASREAYERFERGDLAGARALCRELLHAFPAHAATLHVLGVVELQGKNFAAASAALAASVAAGPDRHAWARLASSRYFEGKLDLALQAADAALAMDAGLVDAHLTRAAALHGLDRFDEALASALEAVRLEPGNAVAAARAGSALERLGRMKEADERFRRAAELTAASKAYSLVTFDPAVLEQIRAVSAAAVREAVPRLEPQRDTQPRYVVLAACDAKYFCKYGFNFVHAFARNAGEGSLLHLHLVDPDAASDAVLDRLARDVRPAHLRVTTEASPFAAGANVAAHTYYSCARFLQLPAFLERYGVPIVSIDIDAILERPLGPLVAAIDGDAGLARRRPSHSPWLEIPAGLVVARPTAAGRAYFELVRNYILLFMRRSQFRWHLDQAALYCVLRMLESAPAPRAGFFASLKGRFSGPAVPAAPRITWIPEALLEGVWQIGHEYDESLADPRFTRYS